MKRRIKESFLVMSCFISLFLGTNGWAAEALIFLDNTSVESINVDRSVLTVLVGYPGNDISGICSIDITADSGHRYKTIRNLIEKLSIVGAFDPEEVEVQIVSNKTARIALAPLGYVDGFTLSPKDEQITLRELIENTLGENREIVVMPRSC
jgi:hypothetical protein